MDILSPAADFAALWCKEHIEPHPLPKENVNKTWFVSADHLYRAYCKAAYEARKDMLSFNDFYGALRILFLFIGTARQAGHPVYTNIRYYRDKVGGHLEFGI